MAAKEPPVLKRTLKRTALLLLLAVVGAAVLFAESSWDSERLNLETNIQKRVEEALSKIIPANQFVLVVKIEPLGQQIDAKGNPVESGDGYFLPGVPERQRFDNNLSAKDLASALKPDSALFKRFIRQISVTLVIDQDISEETVDKVRELTRQMVGLDPQRGDTINVQRTVFQKAPIAIIDNSSIAQLQNSLKNYWVVILLTLILFCVGVFFLFMFGPLRGFLNRFVQVLPTLKPQESEGQYPRMGGGEMPYMPFFPGYGALPGPQAGGNGSNFSGMLQVENPNKVSLPFSFIREDNLGNLSILLSRENPEKAAVVLGYLPSEWISRVLMRIEPAMQTEIAQHLATTRQLLPEQVEDIEQDLKRRLDYMVGGPDRLISIYESLDLDAQKRMVDSLKESRPEVADEIRKRSLLFEDLEKLDAAGLKTILREVDLQTLVMSLHGTSSAFTKKIMDNVSPGKAEIIKEELETQKVFPGTLVMEAQRKVALIARRLRKEGHISVPLGATDAAPSVRYGSGGSLRDSLKLPPALKGNAPETVVEGVTTKKNEPGKNIEDRIKKFMKRGDNEERYPQDDNQTGA